MINFSKNIRVIYKWIGAGLASLALHALIIMAVAAGLFHWGAEWWERLPLYQVRLIGPRAGSDGNHGPVVIEPDAGGIRDGSTLAVNPLSPPTANTSENRLATEVPVTQEHPPAQGQVPQDSPLPETISPAGPGQVQTPSDASIRRGPDEVPMDDTLAQHLAARPSDRVVPEPSIRQGPGEALPEEIANKQLTKTSSSVANPTPRLSAPKIDQPRPKPLPSSTGSPPTPKPASGDNTAQSSSPKPTPGSMAQASKAGLGPGSAGGGSAGGLSGGGEPGTGGSVGLLTAQVPAIKMDHPPVLINQVQPQYPRAARSQGLQGDVQVRFLVDSTGRVQQPQILSASQPGIFDQSVLQALTSWRFKPAIKNGQNADAWVVTTVSFKLVD